nr:hypothetical protein [uncultured Dyadobacter sp.]
MKAILSLLICVVLCWSHVAQAQQFSPTAGIPCSNCQPTGYSKVHSPSISDVWNPSGSQVDKWNIQGPRLPDPPSDYSKGLPFGSGQYSFVTLKTSEGVYDDRVFMNVSGFTVGVTYQLRYSVLSASVHYEAGNNSPYGGSGTMKISTTGPNAVEIASQTTDIDAFSRNQWIKRVITFTPTSSVLQFKMAGTTPGQSAGYINFCIDKYPIDCMLENTQIDFFKSLVTTPFPNDKMNLSTVAIKGVTPQGAELVWKSGPNSTDPTLTSQEAASVVVSNQNPNDVKPYYAFYYAKDFNCYNVPISQAEFKFMYEPTQVSLKQTYLGVTCTEPTGNLTALLDNPIDQVVWFTTNNHQGNVVGNPQEVPPGDYYAFYYRISGGGYSLPANEVSTAHIKVENPIMPGTPDLGPTMEINSLIFPANGSKDFVVNIYNSAGNSNCSVFFKILKLPGFTITYSTEAGTSNVNGGVFNNNDFWTFSEDPSFITVTSKNGIAANGYSAIGFKITRKANTPANSAQNITVTIPQQGGGGEINSANNALINTVTGI